MDKVREASGIKVMLIGAAPLGIPGILGLLLGFGELAFPIVGTAIGALVIWRIVQTINYRNDPRHAKRPPDAP